METRGIRNNNPFNIKKSSNNKWIGKKKKSSDPVFEQFECIDYGIRAGIVLLRRYIKRYHLHSVSDILKRFAPESENDLNAYIRFVKSHMTKGCIPDFVFYPGYDDYSIDVNHIDYGTFSFDLMCCQILLYESKYVCDPNHIRKIRLNFLL